MLAFAPLSYGQSVIAGVPDTVSITLDSAEQHFSKNNLALLAARFNIEGSQAAIQQAQLWNNPNLSVGQNIHNQFTGRWFDFTSTGNTDVEIQQLFLLAGKRGKQVHLAEINSAIAEQTFYNLLRDLSFELRGDFFDLYFTEQSLAFYDEAIPQLQKTVAKTEAIYDRRSILLSEVLRLKSLLFQLETDRLGIVQHISELETDLHILLYDSTNADHYYKALVNEPALDSVSLDTLSVNRIIASALEDRPDYRIAKANVESDETNLALQKSLAIPDLTLGGAWSRAGSYIPNYYALTFSIDLPILNRNQGNIAQAEYTLESDKLSLSQARLGVEREVFLAYKEALENDKLFKTFDRKFTGEYKTLVQGMIESYEKRNISIIEFADFYDSYRTSMLQMNQLQNDRAASFEKLNHAAGFTVLNP
jgi:outer membrane protein TolC